MQSTKKGFVYKAMTIVLTCGLSFSAIPNAYAESDRETKKRIIKEANQGNAEQQYYLGTYYISDGGSMFKTNIPEGIKWLTRAANQDYMDAQKKLGDLYREGEIVRQSGSKAIEWYSKAANQGDKKSPGLLALMYRTGELVPTNVAKVIEWSEKGASLGDTYAPFVAAGMYQIGDVVPQNLTEAKEWYGKACDNGWTTGCNVYKRLSEEGY